jgi:ATP-dependent helicase/nuclease subunit B
LPSSAVTPDDSALILTVNNRLAQELHRRHDRRQVASGKRVWPTPDITPWNAWLRSTYAQLLDSGFTTRILLNQHQERLLWERVVRNSREGAQLLRPAAAARTAQQAWQLVKDWRLDTEPLHLEASDETHAYLAWQAHFDEICQRQGLLSSAELNALLLSAARSGELDAPAQIQLAGFDTISPAQQALLDALEAQGSKIAILRAEQGDSRKQRLELDSPEAEMRMAASWAKQFVEQNPETQLAIVSPRLEEDRDRLERICHQVINPRQLR